jgi:hypothetical protein
MGVILYSQLASLFDIFGLHVTECHFYILCDKINFFVVPKRWES